ncbi:hypothetical protein LCGC14_0732920 [marine sediment metagenome]|uniref:Uncharacterized protein n=1 Tax=marine sediment metagenome TaxID=412755 RepID=A0A0F9TGB8_9ZZZZ
MVAKIKVEDLPEEVLTKLGINVNGSRAMDNRLVVMAMIMRDISGLTSRDALWILRSVIKLIEGARDKKARDKKDEADIK